MQCSWEIFSAQTIVVALISLHCMYRPVLGFFKIVKRCIAVSFSSFFTDVTLQISNCSLIKERREFNKTGLRPPQIFCPALVLGRFYYSVAYRYRELELCL